MLILLYGHSIRYDLHWHTRTTGASSWTKIQNTSAQTRPQAQEILKKKNELLLLCLVVLIYM